MISSNKHSLQTHPNFGSSWSASLCSLAIPSAPIPGSLLSVSSFIYFSSCDSRIRFPFLILYINDICPGTCGSGSFRGWMRLGLIEMKNCSVHWALFFWLVTWSLRLLLHFSTSSLNDLPKRSLPLLVCSPYSPLYFIATFLQSPGVMFILAEHPMLMDALRRRVSSLSCWYCPSGPLCRSG